MILLIRKIQIPKLIHSFVSSCDLVCATNKPLTFGIYIFASLVLLPQDTVGFRQTVAEYLSSKHVRNISFLHFAVLKELTKFILKVQPFPNLAATHLHPDGYHCALICALNFYGPANTWPEIPGC